MNTCVYLPTDKLIHLTSIINTTTLKIHMISLIEGMFKLLQNKILSELV